MTKTKNSNLILIPSTLLSHPIILWFIGVLGFPEVSRVLGVLGALVFFGVPWGSLGSLQFVGSVGSWVLGVLRIFYSLGCAWRLLGVFGVSWVSKVFGVFGVSGVFTLVSPGSHGSLEVFGGLSGLWCLLGSLGSLGPLGFPKSMGVSFGLLDSLSSLGPLAQVPLPVQIRGH